mmetsp:Transcript_59925/g.99588  ORF Transcript_59925/g.99588 Transcript_59925/m.99588 type:complete len:81 (-) Transcript_59925:269-511(-)
MPCGLLKSQHALPQFQRLLSELVECTSDFKIVGGETGMARVDFAARALRSRGNMIAQVLPLCSKCAQPGLLALEASADTI